MKQQDGKLTVANKRINLPKVDYPPNIINLLMNKMKKDKHIKVLFHLEQDEDGYPPFSIEGLWCKKASNDTYNIPYLQPIVTQYLVCNKSEIWP